MSNVHKLPAGLDQQGRFKTRDTASRQIAAEQTWAETMQVPRYVPMQRITRKRSRVDSFCRLLVLATAAWAGFFLAAFILAALVA
jgi:hypothetical protein